MRTLISVIIPVLNEVDKVAELLDTLVRSGDTEIIVVDGGSTDGTQSLVARHPGVVLVESAPGRGIQLNRGAEMAKGGILWFLHVDSELPLGWNAAIREALNTPGVVAGCFRLRFDLDHWLLGIFSLFSRWNHPLATYGDQGYFMSRSVFQELGGFREFPILEDLEIQCRLRKRGSWKKLKLPLTTSARRFETQGILRQQLKNIAIVALFLAGASPFWLSRFYRPQFQLKPSVHSPSLNPAALKEPARRNGRLTRLPFSPSRWKASLRDMFGNLSFKPIAR